MEFDAGSAFVTPITILLKILDIAIGSQCLNALVELSKLTNQQPVKHYAASSKKNSAGRGRGRGMDECQTCGNRNPEYLKECPHCGSQKCDRCDMGDDTNCLKCEKEQTK